MKILINNLWKYESLLTVFCGYNVSIPAILVFKKCKHLVLINVEEFLPISDHDRPWELLRPCYSKYVPQTRNIGVTWKLLGNAASCAHPRPTEFKQNVGDSCALLNLRSTVLIQLRSWELTSLDRKLLFN